MGGEGEGSGVKGGGKWGLGTPLSTPSSKDINATIKQVWRRLFSFSLSVVVHF